LHLFLFFVSNFISLIKRRGRAILVHGENTRETLIGRT